MEPNPPADHQEKTEIIKPAKLGRDEWARLIREYQSGNTSITQFCEDRGFGQSMFYYWRDKLAGKKKKPQRKKLAGRKFIPVSVSSGGSVGIKITLPCGIAIESSPLVDGDKLASLVGKILGVA